ncbi:MAG: MarR family transcriptional regulator [Pseudomonadota bacterium]
MNEMPRLSRIDERLCFALYSTGQAIIARYRPFLAELNMTYPQYLAYIVLEPVTEMSVTELGSVLHLDSGTLSPLLKRMEANGLVERLRDADDERKVQVKLTEHARSLRSAVARMQSEVSCATGLNPDEFSSLLNQLQGLNARLRAD